VIPLGFEPRTIPTEVRMVYPTEIVPNVLIFFKKKLTHSIKVSL
jgi:hypothetical protein